MLIIVIIFAMSNLDGIKLCQYVLVHCLKDTREDQQIFCAVLCTTILSNHMHIYMNSSYL